MCAVANAHAVLAKPCALNSLARHSAPLATAANSLALDMLTVANAHAVLADPCGLNSHARHATPKPQPASCSTGSPFANALAVLAKATPLAQAANSLLPDWLTDVYAHAVTACSDRFILANAHALLADACGLNSLDRHSAPLAPTAASSSSHLNSLTRFPAVANAAKAHAVLAKPCALNSLALHYAPSPQPQTASCSTCSPLHTPILCLRTPAPCSPLSVATSLILVKRSAHLCLHRPVHTSGPLLLGPAWPPLPAPLPWPVAAPLASYLAQHMIF